ncbi:hypothetical protein D3C81_1938120 [compost metagenome]
MEPFPRLGREFQENGAAGNRADFLPVGPRGGDDQLGLLQNLHVNGYGRLGDAKRFGQLADAHRLPAQRFENADADVPGQRFGHVENPGSRIALGVLTVRFTHLNIPFFNG